MSQYTFNENNEAAQFVLFLTKQSSTDITIQVINYDITAVGKWINNVYYYSIIISTVAGGYVDYGSAMGKQTNHDANISGSIILGKGNIDYGSAIDKFGNMINSRLIKNIFSY